MFPRSRILQGIALMIMGMAMFAAMSTTIRALVPYMHTTQMVFLRNLCSLGLMIVWITARGQRLGSVASTRKVGHFWRAAIGFFAMEMWFYSLSIMPLTPATALSFTTPVFSTLFAITILKEKAGWRRWSAIIISFLGVLVVLRPGAETFTSAALIVLASSALMAAAGILVKALTSTEAPETIVFYMAFFMTILSFPLALPHWQPLDAMRFGGVFLIALFSTGAHLLVTRAYLRAELVVLLPFDFTRLLFTGILAYFLFDETMDAQTLAGAGIIIASAVYIAHREAMHGKRKGVDTELG